MMIGSRFSVLTQWDPWIALYKKGLREYGSGSFCASIRSINTPPDVENLLGGKEEVVFPRTPGRCVTLRRGGRRRCHLYGLDDHAPGGPYLQQQLPVPVINPGPLSYKLAELVLGLSLTHSRRAYPKPREPRLDLLGAMLDGAASAMHRRRR